MINLKLFIAKTSVETSGGSLNKRPMGHIAHLSSCLEFFFWLHIHMQEFYALLWTHIIPGGHNDYIFQFTLYMQSI